MKALAVGLLALGVSAPAFAGPYVSSKVAAKGENSDYEKTEVEVRCLLYTSPSPRDLSTSRMPSSA